MWIIDYDEKMQNYSLKTTLNDDLAKEYGIKGLSTCPFMKEGQVFISFYSKPEGFCDEARKAIYQYVFALCNGADGWYFDDWSDTKKASWRSY